MITFEEIEFPSKFHQVVPVVIDKYKKNHVPDSQNSLKFLISGDMTVAQLVYIVRHRMKLGLDHGFNLLFNKGRTLVMMSQRLGEISSMYKDTKGILRFIFAAQNTFGCRVPRIKPIKSIFPGIEPNPFGAPEPSLWFEDTILVGQESEDPMMLQLDDVESTFMQYVLAHSSPTNNQQMDLALESIPPFGADNSTQTGHTPVIYSYVPSAVSSNSALMVVSELSNIFHQPLSALQHSLNQFIPFSSNQLSPQQQPPATAMYSWVNAPLVTSLHQLVEALQNHLSVTSYEPLQTATPSNATSSYAPLDPSLIFIPFDTEMLQPVGHTALPLTSNEILHTLEMANEVMEAVLCDLNSPTPNSTGSNSATIFTGLIPYFQHVAQHLQNETSVTISESQHHSSPILSPSPYSSVNAGQHNSSADIGLATPTSPDGWSTSATVDSFLNNTSNLYHTDSDSSEDDAEECFCDILL